MANKYRGEIDANLDGTGYVLCLTLGALAELESAFGSDDMLALAGRFSSGRIALGTNIGQPVWDNFSFDTRLTPAS